MSKFIDDYKLTATIKSGGDERPVEFDLVELKLLMDSIELQDLDSAGLMRTFRESLKEQFGLDCSTSVALQLWNHAHDAYESAKKNIEPAQD